MSDALSFAREHRARHLAELCEFLRIPSISTAADHQPAMREAATWLARRMREAGLQHVEMIETAGYPLIYGDWLGAPGSPTVLCYAHYDVQPPEPLAEWASPPFEPQVRGQDLFARGASDDKGQLYAVLKAAEAALQGDASCAVNLKFIFEGEEECGSGALKAYLREHGERLRADVALVTDTAFYAPGVPAICLGLRGITYAEIEARGAAHDLHSGAYGGVAPNPLHALALIIAALKDRDGHVRIPGFYDAVVAPSAAEQAAWRLLPFDEHRLREEDMGSRVLAGEPEFDPLTRMWARPTLDVHGISGGYTGTGGKTVIPARASAKVSMRLVPDQRAEDIYDRFARYVRQIAPDEVEIALHRYSADDPVLVAADHPAVRAAAAAMGEAFGAPCALIRSGVTIPIVGPLQRELALPVVLLGFGLPDDRWHAPNEKLHLPNYVGGIEAVLGFWQRYGAD